MVKKSGAGGGRKAAGPTVNARVVAVVVVAALALWFVPMNTASAKIHLWGLSTVSSPLWIILLVMAAVGVVLGWFLKRYRDGGRDR